MTRPKVVIEISDDESEDLEREQAGEQQTVKIEEEDALQQQILDLGTNILVHKNNLTHNVSDAEPNQPTRKDGNDPLVQGDEEAPRASEESYWAREDSESDKDDDDTEHEPVSDDDEEHGGENSAFNERQIQSLDADKDSSGPSRQPNSTRGQTQLDDELEDE
jgi:hypothetical protein